MICVCICIYIYIHLHNTLFQDFHGKTFFCAEPTHQSKGRFFSKQIYGNQKNQESTTCPLRIFSLLSFPFWFFSAFVLIVFSNSPSPTGPSMSGHCQG